jgi:hypothetical protein
MAWYGRSRCIEGATLRQQYDEEKRSPAPMSLLRTLFRGYDVVYVSLKTTRAQPGEICPEKGMTNPTDPDEKTRGK